MQGKGIRNIPMTVDNQNILFQAIADSAVILDRAGRIIDWNHGAASLFGYSAQEVIGRSLNLIYQQNYPFPKIIQDILLHQGKWQTNSPFMRKDGSIGHCRTIAMPAGENRHGKLLTLVIHHNTSLEVQDACQFKKEIAKISAEKDTCLKLLQVNNFLLSRSLATTELLEKQLDESELRFHLLAENATDIISRHAWLYP
jgi:two-component system, LuxR family, sensor kinase FixL